MHLLQGGSPQLSIHTLPTKTSYVEGIPGIHADPKIVGIVRVNQPSNNHGTTSTSYTIRITLRATMKVYVDSTKITQPLLRLSKDLGVCDLNQASTWLPFEFGLPVDKASFGETGALGGLHIDPQSISSATESLRAASISEAPSVRGGFDSEDHEGGSRTQREASSAPHYTSAQQSENPAAARSARFFFAGDDSADSDDEDGESPDAPEALAQSDAEAARLLAGESPSGDFAHSDPTNLAARIGTGIQFTDLAGSAPPSCSLKQIETTSPNMLEKWYNGTIHYKITAELFKSSSKGASQSGLDQQHKPVASSKITLERVPFCDQQTLLRQVGVLPSSISLEPIDPNHQFSDHTRIPPLRISVPKRVVGPGEPVHFEVSMGPYPAHGSSDHAFARPTHVFATLKELHDTDIVASDLHDHRFAIVKNTNLPSAPLFDALYALSPKKTGPKRYTSNGMSELDSCRALSQHLQQTIDERLNHIAGHAKRSGSSSSLERLGRSLKARNPADVVRSLNAEQSGSSSSSSSSPNQPLSAEHSDEDDAFENVESHINRALGEVSHDPALSAAFPPTMSPVLSHDTLVGADPLHPHRPGFDTERLTTLRRSAQSSGTSLSSTYASAERIASALSAPQTPQQRTTSSSTLYNRTTNSPSHSQTITRVESNRRITTTNLTSPTSGILSTHTTTTRFTDPRRTLSHNDLPAEHSPPLPLTSGVSWHTCTTDGDTSTERWRGLLILPSFVNPTGDWNPMIIPTSADDTTPNHASISVRHVLRFVVHFDNRRQVRVDVPLHVSSLTHESALRAAEEIVGALPSDVVGSDGGARRRSRLVEIIARREREERAREREFAEYPSWFGKE
ncbi:hypothetical protein BJ742DRAFT_870175 [Cladochytrium replicatum]|nr:hypothetical protein BJ742DRAFT_870175 [Cladochytrium replicatum]